MINKKIRSKDKGFTLIEVLVAIFILITAVVVPLTIGAKAFAFSNFVRDQSIASYLAQEGVEFIRLQRDNWSLGSAVPASSWSNFKAATSQCFGTYGCRIDVSGLVANCGVSCSPLYQQSSGYYTYSPVTNKSFVRTIKMTLITGTHPALERVKVESTVSWSTNGISSRSITITDYLTPWQI